ncbi:hypothetical protein AMTRI_Chr07g77340 [Amborella trichopoda]
MLSPKLSTTEQPLSAKEYSVQIRRGTSSLSQHRRGTRSPWVLILILCLPSLSIPCLSLSIFSLLVLCSPFLFSLLAAIGSARKPFLPLKKTPSHSLSKEKPTCACELASKMWCDECAKKLIRTNFISKFKGFFSLTR